MNESEKLLREIRDGKHSLSGTLVQIDRYFDNRQAQPQSTQPQSIPGDLNMIVQGEKRTTVAARADQNSVWVEVNRNYDSWDLSPALARRLAHLLNQAAATADRAKGGLP